VIVLKLIKIPLIGGDTMFLNMELAWDTLDEKIKDKR
jgi:taurine dioxygenase